MRFHQVLAVDFLRLIAALGIALATPNLSAQMMKPVDVSLSMADLVDMALRHNYDVQIQRFNPEISRFNLDAGYAPYDPAFRFSYNNSFSSVPSGRLDPNGIPVPPNDTFRDAYQPGITGTLPSGMSYNLNASLQRVSTATTRQTYSSFAGLSISQPILRNMWIDSTRRDILISKRNVDISELALRQQIMSTVTSVQLAYYDLIFALENVKVQAKALELAEKLLAENKKRVEVGALAPLDEKQAESQVAARKAELLGAQRDLATQANVLKNLITDDFAAWRGTNIVPAEALVAVPETPNLQESWTRGMTLRPDLQQLKLTLEQKDISLKYTRNQLFPSLDFNASYGQNGGDTSVGRVLNGIQTGSNPAYSLGAVLTVPFSNRGPRAQYQASRTDKLQSLYRLKKLEQDVLVQIENAVADVRNNFEKVDATRQARLYAEAALEAEQKKLENGKSTSFVVLQLQRDLTAARSSEIRALADYNKSLSTLSLDEGNTLERNKINLQVK